MKSSSIQQDPAKIKRIAKVMRFLGHPVRLQIVELLLNEKRMNVKEIYKAVNISQSNASQHLKILEQADILSSDREGTNVYYWVSKAGVPNLMNCASKCVDD